MSSRKTVVCMVLLSGLSSGCTGYDGAEVENASEKAQDLQQILDTALASLDKGTKDTEYLNAIHKQPKGEKGEATKGLYLNDGSDPVSGFVNKVRNNLKHNFCQYVAPKVKSGGTQFTRPYFAAGVFANAGAMGVQGVLGADWVWDFYNLQFANFVNKGFYSAVGAATLANAGGNVYMAGAFGKKDDVVSAWSGAFQSVGADGSLPFVSQYFSLSGNFFTAAKKMSTSASDGDRSMVGVSVGASLSISPPSVLSALPGDILFGTSEAAPLDSLTKETLKVFKLAGIPVSMSGNATCGGHCIRFDAGVSKGANYSQRAAQLARSFLVSGPFVGAFSNAPAMEALTTMASIALAVGVERDAANAAQKCK